MQKLKLTDFHIKALLVIWVIIGNLLVEISGIVPFEFDSGVYWLPDYALKENLAHNLWHLHTNPPMLNVWAGLLTQLHLPLLLSNQIAFTLLQIIAAIGFFNFLKERSIKNSALWSVILLANPLHFVWFNSFYYPALLFFLSVIVMRILYSDRSDTSKYFWLAFIFSMMAMTRASYHPIWIIALLLPFLKKISFKHFAIGFAFLLIPLGWYTKNYVQYGFWGSSSISGQNLSAHYPDHLRKEIKNCNSLGRYKLVRNYDGLFDENDPLIQRYKDDRLLNDTLTLHNVHTVVISKKYLKETKENFELKYSLATIAYGTFTFFSSPTIDENRNKALTTFNWNHTWLIDYFDLPNIRIHAKNGKYSEIRLAIYTFIYPLVLLFLLLNYRKLDFKEKFLFHWLMIVTLIYCTVDPNEASRMRYETEPVFYFLSLLVLGKITTKTLRH